MNYSDIQVGDTLYFSTPHTTQMRGKAVMKGPYGWVVNAGGRYGTPKVVSPSNFIKLSKSKK